MYISSVGLFGARLGPSQPGDFEQRAGLSDSEGRGTAQSSGSNGAHPPQAYLHQRLQATEHHGKTAPQDRQDGAMSPPLVVSSLHCVLSLAAQCIVIGPVCVHVCNGQAGLLCVFVGGLPR